MPLSWALRFLSVWSGSMAFAESRPVDVCLEPIYGLNSGVILSTLLHLPYPNQGVVWHSVQSVFTRLFTRLLFTSSALQDMCICMLLSSARHRSVDCFSPPKGCESYTKAP